MVKLVKPSGSVSLRRRKQQVPHRCTQCAIVCLLLAAFGSYLVLMVTLTLDSTTTPADAITSGNSPIPPSLRHLDVHSLVVGVPTTDRNDRMDTTKDRRSRTTAATDTTLRAYLEPIHQQDWKTKPLPQRTSRSDNLTVVEYPQLQQCSKLMEQFPVDNFPDDDPFLPWIHDVFPTHDGHFIQFVAQNKRRCHTGTTEPEKTILKHMQPQAALFQHVAIKRVATEGGSATSETRYRLSSHQDADPDAHDTRFICRFKPSMLETLSVFNVPYEYAAWRKGQPTMFTEEGRDNKSIHTSQLLFQCPVPDKLVEAVRNGEHVSDDRASLFVDIVPIRTPPRYGRSNAFFPPRYLDEQRKQDLFIANDEWGKNHILPRIEDSGRWENIPICKPTLMTYGDTAKTAVVEYKEPEKKYRLASCIWASAGYKTRGERFAINDGQRRLQEWIHFNRLVGVEHFYVYDNSAAHTNETSLKPITDMYPDHVTRIVWPSKVCNNNPNNVDSCGERSSQYAAESSCRLRFGPYMDWMAAFDIDEYLAPMGEYTSLLPLIDKLDQDGTKMIMFSSWRAWPRKELIEPPVEMEGTELCGRGSGTRRCFNLRVPTNQTVLQTYNCDRQFGISGPKRQMPAEKQLYRPDYVKLHFIHYSTITELSTMTQKEVVASGNKWRYPYGQDAKGRFADEKNEATMLHTKAVATQDTVGWKTTCTNQTKGTCRIGNPYPTGAYESAKHIDEDGWLYNCWVNPKVEDYWVPLLENSLRGADKAWMN